MYDSLQAQAQGQADKAFALWKENKGHPSLDFSKLQGKVDVWRAEVGDHHRAVCTKNGDRWVWFWIGTHEDYNKAF
jgi:hypothetical protein